MHSLAVCHSIADQHRRQEGRHLGRGSGDAAQSIVRSWWHARRAKSIVLSAWCGLVCQRGVRRSRHRRGRGGCAGPLQARWRGQGRAWCRRRFGTPGRDAQGCAGVSCGTRGAGSAARDVPEARSAASCSTKDGSTSSHCSTAGGTTHPGAGLASARSRYLSPATAPRYPGLARNNLSRLDGEAACCGSRDSGRLPELRQAPRVRQAPGRAGAGTRQVAPPVVRRLRPARRATGLHRPWRNGMRWIWVIVPTVIIADHLDWCHYHLWSVRGMRFHRSVRCHRHARWNHPSIRYVAGY